MRKKLFILSVLFVFSIKLTSAQSPWWLWAKTGGAENKTFYTNIADDDSGNTYISGSFISKFLIFGSATLCNTTDADTGDIFIVKYNSNGDVVWARSAGSTRSESVTSLSVDDSGNVLVLGGFCGGTMNFGSISISDTGHCPLFAAKYDKDGNILWAKAIGGSYVGHYNSVDADHDGNVFIAGYFNSPVLNLGPYTLINTSTGSGDIFLAKYDPDGNILWAKKAGGTYEDYVNSMAVDDSGNAYITGSFLSPSIIFDSYTLTSAGENDIYLAKYDSSGNLQWAKRTGGPFFENDSFVALDDSGNAYLTGSFSSPFITFDQDTLTKSYPNANYFLTKFSAAGNVIWAKKTNAIILSIDSDQSGNIYIAGEASEQNLYLDTLTITNPFPGSPLFFNAKFNNNGNIQWAKYRIVYYYNSTIGIAADHFGNSHLLMGGYLYSFSITKYDTTGNMVWESDRKNTEINGILSETYDNNGNLYIAGYFSNSITFGTTTLQSANTEDNTTDILLLKQDNSGNVIWGKRAGGINDEYATSVATDISGNIYLTGYFTSPLLSFDSIVLTNTASDTTADIFLAKFNSNGNILWAINAGGSGNDNDPSVAVDNSGNVYLTGNFTSPVFNIGSSSFINNGGNDFFVAKFSNNGNMIWAESAGSDCNDHSGSITFDESGSIINTGYFTSRNLTINTILLQNTSTDTTADVYISKYDNNGNILWAKSVDGVSDDFAGSVKTDSDENIFVAGYYYSPGLTSDNTTINNVNPGFSDVFILKYDTSGNLIWAITEGGSENDRFNSIDLDGNGNVFAAGVFEGTDFIAGSNALFNYGGKDMLIIKYDSSGILKWAEYTGGSDDDIANSIVVDPTGYGYVSGNFSSHLIYFNPIGNFPGKNDQNIFSAKFNYFVGIDDQELPEIFTLYPNPGNNTITVDFSGVNEVNFFNPRGQLIKSYKSYSENSGLDISDLPDGFYFVTILTDEGLINTKFIKN